MSSVNSKNMIFIILFIIILFVLFLYVKFSGDFSPLCVNMMWVLNTEKILILIRLGRNMSLEYLAYIFLYYLCFSAEIVRIEDNFIAVVYNNCFNMKWMRK